MRAIRLVLHQTSANYRREETNENKMTYLLPPPSTIIGALHAACGYKEYHPMDISIQGRYESMHREPYTDYCFLNSVMDDRGILVKMRNETMLSTAFEKVAETKKSQGNSFRNNITIHVHNQELIEEYRKLKDLNDEIAAFKKGKLAKVNELLKRRKKTLGEKKKLLDKSDCRFLKVQQREAEVKEFEKMLKKKVDDYQTENYTKPIARFRSITTSLKYYEVLDEIDLILHVRADEETLQTIMEHIYNLKCIGRSEDMVQVKEAKLVELVKSNNCNVFSFNGAYIRCEDLKQEHIYPQKLMAGQEVSGTKYYLNKNYEIVDGKRIFNKVKALYISEYGIDQTSENVFLDIKDTEAGNTDKESINESINKNKNRENKNRENINMKNVNKEVTEAYIVNFL